MRVSIFLDLASLFSSSVFLTTFVYFKLLSLNEAIVVSQRCLAWKESLMHVKAQLVKLESCKKYLNHIVAELTKEKREVVVELEKLMAELAARDDDMKVAMEDKDKVVADLQHLVGQIEGAKATAVSKYRASKDFDDNNTRYFLSGLETFRKQVGERFPDLYFLSSSYMTMMTRSWRELMGLKLMTRLMMLLQNDLVFMLSFLDVT
jgi:hypothetical protein